MAESGVRAEQQEEIGETGNRSPQVRARGALPHFAREPPVGAAHLLGHGRITDVKAGAEDDRVDLALDAVADRPTRAAPRQASGHELDVGPQRRIPAVGGQDPLTAEHIVGVTCARSAGSATCFSLCAVEAVRASPSAAARLAKPSTSSSLLGYTAPRTSLCAAGAGETSTAHEG